LKDKLPIQNTILRYLDTPEDEALMREIHSIRTESAENEVFFQEIKRIWEASAETGRLHGLDGQASIDKLWSGIGGGNSSQQGKTRVWFRVAAAILLFSAVGFWFYTNQNEEPLYLVKENNGSQVDSLRLADGTKIMLAAKSSVKYPQKFDAEERRVQLLNGQAFFLVARNTKHPFAVQVGPSIVRVLGTSFNIQFSPSDIEIAVKTGRVSFTPNSSSTPSLLDAGDALRYNLVRNEINRQNGSNATSWLTKELHFVDTPLDEVCRQLSQHFSVKIVLGKNVNPGKKFNATFKDHTLDEVLELLIETYPVSITKADTLITIKSL
jgi:ferric-dicitrate binding protein FerR (iron transport regulator)